MRELTLYTGRKVQVPVDDYNDFIGYKVTDKKDEKSYDESVAAYIDAAFSGKAKIWKQAGCGHIVELEYVPTYQIMRVEFVKYNDVCVFFRVPKEVYSELENYAKTKQTSLNSFDGSERHVLGIRFWDVVRIRGSRTGAKYRFEYDYQGERTGWEGVSEAREEALVASGTAEFQEQEAKMKKESPEKRQQEDMKDLLDTIKSFFKSQPSLVKEAEGLKTYKELTKWARQKGVI
jgi:predicted HicB family RNase H-like nuclease